MTTLYPKGLLISWDTVLSVPLIEITGVFTKYGIFFVEIRLALFTVFLKYYFNINYKRNYCSKSKNIIYFWSCFSNWISFEI